MSMSGVLSLIGSANLVENQLKDGLSEYKSLHSVSISPGTSALSYFCCCGSGSGSGSGSFCSGSGSGSGSSCASTSCGSSSCYCGSSSDFGIYVVEFLLGKVVLLRACMLEIARASCM
eukprot:990426_1